MIRKGVPDTNNPVIQLCVDGTRAEFEHRLEDVKTLYLNLGHSRENSGEKSI
jgi:hypothetical protein